MLPEGEFKGRINVGALITHDHRVLRWPDCCPPAKEYEGRTYECRAVDPHMIFVMTVDGIYVNCYAPGYGEVGNYGNGSILVCQGGVTPC